MATSVLLDEDVYEEAVKLAAERHQTVDQVVNEASRRGFPVKEPLWEIVNGLPVIRRRPGSVRVTREMVERFKDELD